MLRQLRNVLGKFISTVDRFWFEEQSTLSLGVFRVSLGLLILFILICSIPNWEFFYGAYGPYPLSALREAMGGYTSALSISLLAFSDQNWLLWAVLGFNLICATAFTLGWQTRWITIAMFIGWSSLCNRNITLINGQDQIIKMMLFLGCFAPMGNSLSIDRWWQEYQYQKSNGQTPKPSDLRPICSWRLMQTSIAILYLFAGPSKLVSDEAWRNGTALYYVSLSDRWYRFYAYDFMHNLNLNALFTYATLGLQISFPYLVWIEPIGELVVLAAMLAHVSMFTLLSRYVFHFNLAVLVSFIVFVKPLRFEQLFAAFHKLWPRFLLFKPASSLQPLESPESYSHSK
ncbi:MAG: hypothetical protein NW237_04425 [Cyanobacteriota bacterium]|nr:hypothetical protein [Cyanobacteriota bacterium]